MVDAITPAAPRQANQTGLGDLGTDVFLQLLVAQLRNQNPLEPMDGSALMQQTTQLASVEAIQAMSDLQSQIVGLSQFGNATAMIGKTVQAEDPVLGLIEGVVTGVKVTPAGSVLQIGSRDVSIDNVIGVFSQPTVGAVAQAGAKEQTPSTTSPSDEAANNADTEGADV